MSTLYLDRKGLEIRLDGGAVVLYEAGHRVGTVPLKMLKRIVIRAETSLTSSLLGAIAEAGAATVILSGRQGRRLAIISGRPHNDARLRVAQYAMTQDSARRLSWAGRFLCAKISRQVRFLTRALAERADRRKEISDAMRTLRAVRIRIAVGNANSGRLRGFEGAAQAAYFRAYVTLFSQSLGFRKRNRRPPRDPVNACLSLAYTLVHFEAVRACYETGLDPFLGFFHEIAFGRESLACDLIEPVRPLVDGWVWNLFRERTVRAEHFALDKGSCLLGKTGRARFYERFEEFLIPVANRLRGYCRFLARGLRSQMPDLTTAGEED